MAESQHLQKKLETKQLDSQTPAVQQSIPKEMSNSAMLLMHGGRSPAPMSSALREKFEPAFNADFSNVRISRGKIPEKYGAEAFARGTDIYLDSSAGDNVLGHELAHVVQQANGRVPRGGFPFVHNPSLEHEADVLGARAANGVHVGGGEQMSIAPMSSASAPVQAKSKEDKEREKSFNKQIKNMPKDQKKRLLDRKKILGLQKNVNKSNVLSRDFENNGDAQFDKKEIAFQRSPGRKLDMWKQLSWINSVDESKGKGALVGMYAEVAKGMPNIDGMGFNDHIDNWRDMPFPEVQKQMKSLVKTNYKNTRRTFGIFGPAKQRQDEEE